MAGKAMVAATEATLMTTPPWPAAPPGRIVRNACLMPSAVPSRLISSILRACAASRSTSRLVISTPALLTRMSRPPSWPTASATAVSQPASSETSRCTKPCPSPSASATFGPRSSWTSAMTTVAPASARARAIPSPRPWAPPVTRALRPVRSRSGMGLLLGCRGSAGAPVWRRSQRRPEDLTTVKTSLDICQEKFGHLSRERPLLPYSDEPTTPTDRRPGRRTGGCHQAGAAPARRQARRTTRPARRVRAPNAGRAWLRPHQPARDREQLRVQPRGRALLLRRQARADRLLRALLQGPLRDEVRRGGRRLDVRRGAARRVRGQAGRDGAGRGTDAQPLVRPPEPEHVRGPAARGRDPHRPDASGHDLAHRQPLLRAGRAAARDDPGRGVRRARRAVPAGAARPRHRGRVRAADA